VSGVAGMISNNNTIRMPLLPTKKRKFNKKITRPGPHCEEAWRVWLRNSIPGFLAKASPISL